MMIFHCDGNLDSEIDDGESSYDRSDSCSYSINGDSNNSCREVLMVIVVTIVLLTQAVVHYLILRFLVLSWRVHSPVTK